MLAIVQPPEPGLPLLSTLPDSSTASLCVAVDESGNVLSSGSPGSGGWTIASIDPGHHLRAVSCSSQSLCVAVDGTGNVISSVNPAGDACASSRAGDAEQFA